MPVILQKLQISILFEVCALLGYYTSYGGNSLLKGQDNLSVPSSRVKKSSYTICCVISQKSAYHLLCGELLKSREVLYVVVIKLGGFKNSVSVHFLKFTSFCFSIWCPVCGPDTVLLPDNFLCVVKQCLG